MQTELEFPDLQIRPRRGSASDTTRPAEQTVGRADEVRLLQEYADRRQDTLVLGPSGAGKSHLLALVRGQRIVRVRSLNPARQTLLEIAEILFQAGVLRVQAGEAGPAAGTRATSAVNAAPRTVRPQAPRSRQPADGDPPTPASAVACPGIPTDPARPSGAPSTRTVNPPRAARSQAPDARQQTAGERPRLAGAAAGSGVRTDPARRVARPAAVTPARLAFAAFRKQHAGTTISGWTRLVTQAVPPRQWLLVVDDLSGLTRVQGQLLDQLAERFAILAAATELPRTERRRFARFKRIPLANLGRRDATALMRRRLAGARMDNPRLVEAYLWHRSVGNPRAIVEMIDQLRREPAITEDAARHLEYPGARPQLDLTPIILIPAVFLVAARFVARGLGDTEAYILAGVGAALVMGLQFLLFRLRR